MAQAHKGSASRDLKRKHCTLSIKDKLELLKKLDSGVSVRSLCGMYNIGSSTVYDLKRQKGKLVQFVADSGLGKEMGGRKTLKGGNSTDLDKVLITWLKVRVREGVQISGNMVKEQARIFHKELGLPYQCDYSTGWLRRFMERHGLRLRAVCGEKRPADNEAAAAFVDEFTKLVSDEQLSPEQVYNADETALFWKSTPRRTLTTADAESPAGHKASKERVTVLCCSNAAGTHRCTLLVIGKHLHPRAFRGMVHLPVIYRASRNRWMTREITSEWFERHFVPEERAHCSIGLDKDCKIVLTLDNCPAHPVTELVKKNVHSVRLPPKLHLS
ncbi:hypothetical protein M514_11293 [Trichuris suis]|uniref:HTH CENPB-type domain-containing protein n=1 Tax=Trichuris suis TaxID=68888 RepID=A0A085MXS0_9BILA|nr:hypothetical protein M514_11293 [Trichuris suis]